ncbi:fasciculation and elongation protein zeta-1 [Engraulis encrasicolus]|uniref:fasciculation and elongation protein zeta-1 n=1 Tax=Engraulis encrasicolus TaxID=184585 RepID=UPI002FD44D49
MEAPLVCLDEEFEDLRPCRMEDLEPPVPPPRRRHQQQQQHLGNGNHSNAAATAEVANGNNSNDLDDDYECDYEYSEFSGPKPPKTHTMPLAPIQREEFSELENFSEMMSFKSMEDLVNEFDEKLNVCFHNYNTKTEGLAPVRNKAHAEEDEERLQDEDVWDALSDNYMSSVSSWDPNAEGSNGNLSDQEIHEKEEEEMNEKNENANLQLSDEPLVTADQVIEEIVEMMENSPDPGETEEEEEEEESTASTPKPSTSPSLLEEIRALSLANNNNCSYEGLSLMSKSALEELLCRVEAAIREYSEELVAQLARREELDFEKEVKNSFITALMEVQNRQKETRGDGSKQRKRRDKGLSLQSNNTQTSPTGTMPVKRFSMEGLSNILQTGIRQTFGNSGTDKQYLNTVIPYEKKASPPSVEDLQMLTKILYAMKEDSEKVPVLLTDYILKVLCPT